MLFIGLWCLADREGRLEDRAKRIEAEVFPYEKIDIEMHMHALASTTPPFIVRYEKNQNRYVQVVNFLRHQTPNNHEKRSEIPPFKCNALPRKCNAPLIPDVLIPDVLIPDIPITTAVKINEWFLKTWNAYPKERRHGKDVAFKRYQKAVKDVEGARQVARALDNYLASKVVKDGFIMRASKWFEEWEDWKNDDRRNSESLHDPVTDTRPDSVREGTGEQAAIADTNIKRLADSKTL